MSENVHSPQEEHDPKLSNDERHLQGLLAFRENKPWVVSFVDGVRDYFFPKKQPPLAVTSRPLTSKEMGSGTFIVAPEARDSGAVLPAAFRPGVAMDSDHLTRLAATGVEASGLETFLLNIRDLIAPPKQGPLEVTSKPVQVKDIWGFSGGHGRNATVITMAVHGGAIAFMFLIGATHVIENTKKETISLIEPIDIAPYIPQTKPQDDQMGGGGGGGDRSPLPASKGQLPKLAYEQFVPPAAVIRNPTPELVMQPTIVVPPDTPMPNVAMNVWGDPLAAIGPPSNGTGSGGGIGDGSGGGVGSGRGPGYGPGEGGGVGGGVYKIGGGVSSPSLVFKVEPEYSEEARKAKFQGTVVLYVVVNEKGLPQDLRVVRPLGLGLDEKAIEAVKQWRFRPGYLNGEAVAVAATIEVNFRLL